MIDMPSSIIVLIFVTFCAAGVVKGVTGMGVTGMGLPTVAMGVLGAFISPLAAASLLIVLSFATNLWQLWRGRHSVLSCDVYGR
ncbi:hypothetical protein [Brucella suis]|uniref:Sulfite exporter TauE/SafE family protein n=1 Tax=Brucella suis (strain ATCC 23445 / NCTC 10510) TaxID=470137 RepID=B0CIG0_BRUSI|nr:hypothetical protein [Brucella suis]ABY38766.1 protein of unknown function DUF81 [Brucella suis ATCC 23445]AIB18416.1 membrane protein, putative [Brucella suis bv. 2]AIB31918.1 Putative membrane protein [Brucella suis bv. 2]ENR23518.1 hypothetical protein C050_01565 [Brucella suis 92/63]ENR40907.1 hypothetical protein C063_01546 [Brucella suis F8/06-2]